MTYVATDALKGDPLDQKIVTADTPWLRWLRAGSLSMWIVSMMVFR
jgi:hypothetical protein